MGGIIEPRDKREEEAVGLAGRITAGIGIVGTAAVALASAVGGMAWLADNIPLLVTGLTALATGGFTSWVAVRRMRMDKRGMTEKPRVNAGHRTVF